MAKDRGRKADRATKGPRIASHLIALEPRMMFDGAAVTTALATTDVTAAHDGFDFSQDPFVHNNTAAYDPQLQAFAPSFENDDQTLVSVWRTTEALGWLPVTFNAHAPDDNGDQPDSDFPMANGESCR
jgi:hypothetical protein